MKTTSQRRCSQCREPGHYKKKCKAPYCLIVRTCNKCGEEKFYTEFSKLTTQRTNECKSCTYIRYRKWSNNNPSIKKRGFKRFNGNGKRLTTTMILDSELKDFIQEYAYNNQTHVSTILNEMILELKKKEERRERWIKALKKLLIISQLKKYSKTGIRLRKRR